MIRLAQLLDDKRLGLIDNWLSHIRDVLKDYGAPLAAISNPSLRADRLCELNVIEQTINVCETTIVRDAWARGQSLAVHGWIFAMKDGLLRDLGVSVSDSAQINVVHARALAACLAASA